MAIQIIERCNGEEAKIETINRIQDDAPQISYSSEGRLTIRIPRYNGDFLVVLDRPLSRELIRFVKNGIQENPYEATWCDRCGGINNDSVPF